MPKKTRKLEEMIPAALRHRAELLGITLVLKNDTCIQIRHLNNTWPLGFFVFFNEGKCWKLVFAQSCIHYQFTLSGIEVIHSVMEYLYDFVEKEKEEKLEDKLQGTPIGFKPEEEKWSMVKELKKEAYNGNGDIETGSVETPVG